MRPWVIEMKNITKRFGPVLANDNVDLLVRQQEVHVLLGENGAGKSTLMNILFGIYEPDAGKIVVKGKEVLSNSPAKALESGLGMVHQHFMLVDRLTVLENIILGYEPGNVLVDYRESRVKVQKLLDTFHFQLNLDALVETLPVGVKQRVEIIKTLYRGAEIIIFDEPTAVLTPPEVQALFQVFKELKKDGKTIIFITHKLNETMEVADRITVLRNGKNVKTLDKDQTSPEELASLMVGRKVNFNLSKAQINRGKEILKLQDVRITEQKEQTINLQVFGGEILGIAGVEGNGQMEMEELITGLRPCKAGRIFLRNHDITAYSVRQRKKLGLAHIPSDRHKRAMLSNFTVAENILLGRQFRPEWVKHGIILRQKLQKACRQLIASFQIKTSGLEQKIRFLSGGNQQKVILAREVSTDPDLIVAAQPTRGLDVGAIEYIHSLLLQLREQGKGIILISADLQEITKLSDRIAVLYEGEIRAVKPAGEFTQEELGLLMAGKEGAK